MWCLGRSSATVSRSHSLFLLLQTTNEVMKNVFQTPGAATSEAAGSPTGAEGLLLAAAHLGPLGTDSPLGEVDGGGGAPASQLKKGGKKPRRSAVNIVYGGGGS